MQLPTIVNFIPSQSAVTIQIHRQFASHICASSLPTTRNTNLNAGGAHCLLRCQGRLSLIIWSATQKSRRQTRRASKRALKAFARRHDLNRTSQRVKPSTSVPRALWRQPPRVSSGLPKSSQVRKSLEPKPLRACGFHSTNAVQLTQPLRKYTGKKWETERQSTAVWSALRRGQRRATSASLQVVAASPQGQVPQPGNLASLLSASVYLCGV